MHVVNTKTRQRRVRRIIKRVKDAVSVALLIAGFTTIIAICGYLESHYNIEAKITERVGCTYTVVDTAGYSWKFTDSAVYDVGTEVVLNMHNSHTATRNDDAIVKVKEK